MGFKSRDSVSSKPYVSLHPKLGEIWHLYTVTFYAALTAQFWVADSQGSCISEMPAIGSYQWYRQWFKKRGKTFKLYVYWLPFLQVVVSGVIHLHIAKLQGEFFNPFMTEGKTYPKI